MRCSKIKCPSTLLKVRTFVRLAATDKSIKTFTRFNDPKFTREVFRISRVNSHHHPPTYELTPLESTEPIKGFAYKQELSVCSKPEIFSINVLKTRVRKQKTQMLVEYSDYPESKPVWINEGDLIQ